MNKENLILIVLGLLLLAGMLYTLLAGGSNSRHGYGRDLSTEQSCDLYGSPVRTG